jgi:hypothetical protein
VFVRTIGDSVCADDPGTVFAEQLIDMAVLDRAVTALKSGGRHSTAI